MHADGAQQICPVSTQLFLWLARKHFLFHADFLRRVLSIFSIRCFQHQSHFTIWIKVVLYFWCFLCTRLNLGYNPPLKIFDLLRSLLGFYHLRLQDEKIIVHENLWSKPRQVFFNLHCYSSCLIMSYLSIVLLGMSKFRLISHFRLLKCKRKYLYMCIFLRS